MIKPFLTGTEKALRGGLRFFDGYNYGNSNLKLGDNPYNYGYKTLLLLLLLLLVDIIKSSFL